MLVYQRVSYHTIVGSYDILLPAAAAWARLGCGFDGLRLPDRVRCQEQCGCDEWDIWGYQGNMIWDVIGKYGKIIMDIWENYNYNL